ncbi:hypothetical protein P691DRAFT_762149 [Macrolepiota fuliginosa MF-IS2]|uniref:Mid2 domain-containing protein n=1 Tax=Macrolepiota fuliginosa MF-IS2 TaxID=1400762 RepID=A0A9P6BZ44_9AGAR|nr:hypothetical protein P691DRAFT_762149 [Macrolepiota fuliginosa MF-IS2]
MRGHVLFLLVAYYIVGSVAQRNVTVDDMDNAIVYTNSGWSISTFSTLDYNGTHHLTNDDKALATFTFTGTAVYFVSPLWPYAVSTQLQLDSQSPISLNLTDPTHRTPDSAGSESVSFAVIWGSGPLSNTTHTVLLSKTPNIEWAVVDALIYTVSDPPPTTSASSSAPSSASSSKHVVAIAVGAALGSLVLLSILAAAIWFFRRGKKRSVAPDWTISGDSPKKTSSPPGPLSPPEVQFTQLQYPYENNTNASWTGSTPQMSIINASMGTVAQPYGYHQINNQPTQGPDPLTAPVHIPATIQHPSSQHSLRSATHFVPTTVSSTPDSNRLPSLASHASFPSTDLSYHTPPQPIGNATRLSYTSDMSASASVAAASQHQHMFPGGSASQLQPSGSSISVSDAGPKLGKLEEKGSMVAVNRNEDDSEGSRPPAYTLT